MVRNGRNTECKRTMYVPPFLDFVLQTELPRGRKLPKFTKFAGDVEESSVEHVARYQIKLGDLVVNEYLRMKCFPNSLTKNVITWFTMLPPQSVQIWIQLEKNFHEQFHTGQSKISLIELSSFKQKSIESIDQYLNKFRFLKVRCFT